MEETKQTADIESGQKAMLDQDDKSGSNEEDDRRNSKVEVQEGTPAKSDSSKGHL